MSRSIATGYLFLEGEYIAPPYRIRQEGETLTVNDRRVPTQPAPEFWEDDDPGRRPRWGGEIPVFERIVSRLEGSDVLVIFDDGTIEQMARSSGGLTLLKYFLAWEAGQRSPAVLEMLLAELPAHLDRSPWRDWLSGYVPPADLLERAQAELEAYERVLNENLTSIEGRRRFDTWSYPLTVLGMVVAVLALGHLLSCRPDALDPLNLEDRTAGIKGRVARTVTLIVLLSGLDLVWTVLAWQGNQMRELNPLGSQLIDDTAALIAFKGTATLASAGLLFALHRHPSARIASWWVCLICTIVAFRWLTFNSMFIS